LVRIELRYELLEQRVHIGHLSERLARRVLNLKIFCLRSYDAVSKAVLCVVDRVYK
jgi:hypothetical protein